MGSFASSRGCVSIGFGRSKAPCVPKTSPGGTTIDSRRSSRLVLSWGIQKGGEIFRVKIEGRASANAMCNGGLKSAYSYLYGYFPKSPKVVLWMMKVGQSAGARRRPLPSLYQRSPMVAPGQPLDPKFASTMRDLSAITGVVLRGVSPSDNAMPPFIMDGA